MTGLLAGFCALLGVCIGSFVNVVAWRLPRGESLLRPGSACPRCGHPIRARDNVPVLGWLLLRGRCRDCRLPVSRRYPLVELGCGSLFLAFALAFGPDPVLPAYLYLAAVCLALSLIDIDTRRLPDRLTLPSYAVFVLLLSVGVVASAPPGALVRALLGGLAMFGLYFALWFAYPSGMGFGDVKLAGLLGVATAWVGWGAWAVGVFFGFLYGGAFGIVLLLARGASRKTKVPYGPFLVAGGFTGVLAGGQLFADYLSLTAV